MNQKDDGQVDGKRLEGPRRSRGRVVVIENGRSAKRQILSQVWNAPQPPARRTPPHPFTLTPLPLHPNNLVHGVTPTSLDEGDHWAAKLTTTRLLPDLFLCHSLLLRYFLPPLARSTHLSSSFSTSPFLPASSFTALLLLFSSFPTPYSTYSFVLLRLFLYLLLHRFILHFFASPPVLHLSKSLLSSSPQHALFHSFPFHATTKLPSLRKKRGGSNCLGNHRSHHPAVLSWKAVHEKGKEVVDVMLPCLTFGSSLLFQYS